MTVCSRCAHAVFKQIVTDVGEQLYDIDECSECPSQFGQDFGCYQYEEDNRSPAERDWDALAEKYDVDYGRYA